MKFFPLINSLSTRNCLVIIGLVILVSSCTDSLPTRSNSIYFGGEIINPDSNFVTLFKENGITDTIYLDEKNRFLKKYDSLQEGLYFFIHQPEGQIVFLEKGDSILARVNMVEFDESLVFSGRGAQKNNFLIDMFLSNEKEREQNIFDFNLPPEAFLKKVNDTERARFAEFEKFKDKVMLTDLGKKILTNSFVCHYNTQKETYPSQHFGNNLSDAQRKFKELPDSFFDFRKDVNPNDTDLKMGLDYSRFLSRYIDNKAYMDFAIKNNYKEEEPNATLRKLHLIDSIFEEEYIKNFLLKGITRQFIDFNEDRISSDKVLQKFLAINTDSVAAKTMTRVVNYTTKLTPRNIIPNQKLIASDSTIVYLSDLSKKKPLTAIYFWSVLDIQYYKRAHTKVAELRAKFPQVQFISINIDEDKTKKWINVLDKYQYLRDYEYQFDDAGKSRNELVLYQYTRDKTILLGKGGQILNPNANIFDPNFEKELEIYTSQQNYDNNILP